MAGTAEPGERVELAGHPAGSFTPRLRGWRDVRLGVRLRRPLDEPHAPQDVGLGVLALEDQQPAREQVLQHGGHERRQVTGRCHLPLEEAHHLLGRAPRGEPDLQGVMHHVGQP